jgi:hypothetical protein
MPPIRDEQDQLERTIIYLMCKFQLVWLMHIGTTIVLVKLVFCCIEDFRIEQRAAFKFCVKLKKTATETFEMLKSVYCEECLSRTSVFEWHKMFKEAHKVRMQKSRVKTMLTAFFYAESIIHHEFVLEKQTLTVSFIRRWLRDWLPEFRESGSWYLLH